jgi:hypothetical protein
MSSTTGADTFDEAPAAFDRGSVAFNEGPRSNQRGGPLMASKSSKSLSPKSPFRALSSIPDSGDALGASREDSSASKTR